MTSETEKTELDESSILDSALLESLFYNEFAEDPNFRASLMTSLSESNGDGIKQAAANCSVTDPNTVAEKALLHDFGVDGTTRTEPPMEVDASSATSGELENTHQNPNTSGRSKDKLEELAASRLGSRLGVSSELLHSLQTKSEPENETTQQSAPVFSKKGISLQSAAGTNVITQARSSASLASASSAPQVMEDVKSAADEAIAAVTKKRSAGSADDSNKPAYSKRRKKPRLEDCESKLMELKSENDMLKRHLANISQQTHAHDKERIEAEEKMQRMLRDGASAAELDAMVEFYKEMFSDYGRRRHQEIVFHLEQLSRLANPTNFTKMGLWTLGQQSKGPNPITGILTRELDIQPQQVKKILDQREKIREVCSNLKESLALLGKLKTLCEQKTSIFNDRMSKCREILAPAQVVKLLVWINNHNDVLHTVFPGWGSQMLQSLPNKLEEQRN